MPKKKRKVVSKKKAAKPKPKKRKPEKPGPKTRLDKKLIVKAELLARRPGANNIYIYIGLGISADTFYEYVKTSSEFSDAIKRGREIGHGIALEKVVNSLYKTALGYDYEETHTKTRQVLAKNGTVITCTDIEIITRHVPGREVAQFFYLVNKDPENWKHKQEVFHDMTALQKEKNESLERLKKIQQQRKKRK